MKKLNYLHLTGAVALAITVYLNVRHALNDYGVRDNKHLHAEILAQASTTSGNGSNSGGSGSNVNNGNTTQDTEYSYLKELEAEECPLKTVTASAMIIYRGITIPAGGRYTIYGSKKVCSFWLFARCDQNKTTQCQAIGSSTN
jgi:hypothetical protein